MLSPLTNHTDINKDDREVPENKIRTLLQITHDHLRRRRCGSLKVTASALARVEASASRGTERVEAKAMEATASASAWTSSDGGFKKNVGKCQGNVWKTRSS